MKQRALKKGFTFPYLQDKGQHIYPKYGATSTPHVFILEKQKKGNVVQYIGTIDDNSRSPEKIINGMLKTLSMQFCQVKSLKLTQPKPLVALSKHCDYTLKRKCITSPSWTM